MWQQYRINNEIHGLCLCLEFGKGYWIFLMELTASYIGRDNCSEYDPYLLVTTQGRGGATVISLPSPKYWHKQIEEVAMI